MKPGELKERRRRKVIDRLRRNAATPHFTTTECFAAMNAGCGPARFHQMLAGRKLATPITSGGKGYRFNLHPEYGAGTLSIKDHHSFQWSPKGLLFIGGVLAEEGVSFEMPSEVQERLDRNGSLGN